jgi:hypothetical protein
VLEERHLPLKVHRHDRAAVVASASQGHSCFSEEGASVTVECA